MKNNNKLRLREQESLASEELQSRIDLLDSKFFNLASSIIVILGADKKIRYINKAGLEVLEYPKSDLIGKDWFRLCIPPEDYQVTSSTFKKIISGKLEGVAVFENQIITNTGKKILIRWHNTYLRDSKNKIIGTVSFGDNIESEIAIKKELAENEEKFRALAEQSNNAIFLSQNGHIIYANLAAANMTGYSLEEMYGPKFVFWDHIDKAYWPEIDKARLRHQKVGNPMSYECVIMAKDSSKLPVIINSQAIKYLGNIAVLGTVTDISALKKVEMALRKSEAMLKTTLSVADDLVFIIDEKGLFTYFSCRDPKMLYAKPEFFMFKQYGAVLPPEVSKKMKRALSVCRGGQGAQYEYMLKMNGNLQHFSAKLSPIIIDEKYCGAVAIVRDITKEKEVESILKESEEKYRRLVQLSPNAIVIHQDNKIVFANQAALRLAKLPSNSGLYGMDIMQFIHPEHKDEVAERIKQMAILHKKVSMLEVKMIDAKNNLLYGELYSSPIIYGGRFAIMTVVHNITDRKLMEIKIQQSATDLKKALKESEIERDRYRWLLECIGEGILVTDRLGIVLMCNSAAQEMLHLSAKEIIGQKTAQLVDLIDEAGIAIPQEERPCFRAIKTKKKVSLPPNKEYFFVRHDGTRFPIMAVAAPFQLDGELVGSIISFSDITKEKEFERVKSDFVSLASHQLRTPIGIMRWYLEMLIAGDLGKLNDQQLEYLKETWRSNKRLAELVNALLNISRIEAGIVRIVPKIIDLPEICRQICYELEEFYNNKNILLYQEYHSGLKEYSADEAVMKIIIQNILSNAFKYTPKGGTIKLKIDKEKTRIVISVTDNGLGIPVDEVDKIFTRLYRASNIQKTDTDGTGLGLYIVKSLVEAANGKIWLESQQNKGSTFYISLPLEGMKAKKGSRGLEFSNYKM